MMRKMSNLKEKYHIIDEIKELVNRDESINKTFQEFRDLQKRWHDVGVVPQQSLKDLWETYHYHVEKFYDYIKINKELRDLDLKKNLEAKIGLCEKAEALLLEPNVVNAFQTLQNYHDQWREIGPVPKEKRTEIWERFKDATSKINKRHQQYYQDLKETQKKNLESKTVLCEKAEELAGIRILRATMNGSGRPMKCWNFRRCGKPSASLPRRTITGFMPAFVLPVICSSRKKGDFMLRIWKSSRITSSKNWIYVYRPKPCRTVPTGKARPMN